MLSKGLQDLFTDIPITVVGLLLFVIAFSSVVAYVLTRKNGFKREAMLPFHEGMSHE